MIILPLRKLRLEERLNNLTSVTEKVTNILKKVEFKSVWL